MSPHDWRVGAELTQASVAKLLGIAGRNPASTWQKWEAGKLQPPLRVIQAVERLSRGKVCLDDWIALQPAPKHREAA